MINIPTTDILTPITGEVEKTATTDHGDPVDVSFLSVISAEDTDADALISLFNPLPVTQVNQNSQTGHSGLAVALPAFTIVPEPVLPPQTGLPPTLNQSVTSPASSNMSASAMDGAKRDAQLAMAADARQITPVTPPIPQQTQDKELGAASRPIIDVPDQVMIANQATDVPAIRTEGAALLEHPAATEPLVRGNLTGQLPNDKPVPTQYNFVGPAKEGNADSAVRAKQDTPIGAPIIAALPDTTLPRRAAVFSEAPIPLVAPAKVGEQPQEKLVNIQQASNASQAQRRTIESTYAQSQSPIKKTAVERPITPKSVSAPVQNPPTGPVRMPAVAQPMTPVVSGTTVNAQKSVLDTDVAQFGVSQSDVMRVSTDAPSQIATEATRKRDISLTEIQTPAPGRQSQTKQPPQQPVQPIVMQLPPARLAPQVTLSPIAKQDNQPAAVRQTYASSESNRVPTSPPTDMATMGPLAPAIGTTTAEALDPLSTRELMPFEMKSAESPMALRQDANINRPEVMRHVAQQLVDVARQMPDRPVELALNPEELGRVRLTFTATDGGIHVAVMAERGETMDLLRRHIETLAQEFREMGYKDVKFEFSRNGQNDEQNKDSDAQNSAESDATSAQAQTLAPVQLSLEPTVGLDLRL